MDSISRSPIYNIKAVLNETGLSADALRAWERRYGLPRPQRTPGGHRLYSAYDIETIKWLKARLEEGLSISRAVQSWNEIVNAGGDPLQAGALPTPPAEAIVHPEAALTQIEHYRAEWLEAGMGFDERRADHALNQAFAVYPVETVVTQILQSGLSQIGEAWYHAQVSVQQEHFISAMAVRRLNALLTAAPPPVKDLSVLIGAPANEWHSFPLLLLMLLLRRQGVRVVYLGADVPGERMVESAAVIRPDLVILAAQQLTTAATLRAAALQLQRRDIPLGYGGLIFNRLPALIQRIPGHFLGESIERAYHLITGPGLPPAPPVEEAGTDPCRELARLFREKRPAIELELHERVKIEYLATANRFFGNGLNAALELGDPVYLEADMQWIARILIRRGLPESALPSFLEAYSRQVDKALGAAGVPITAWINAYLDKVTVPRTGMNQP